MKNTYHLTTGQLRAALDALCEKLIVTHKPVDLIAKAQYRKVRHELSAFSTRSHIPRPTSNLIKKLNGVTL